MSDYQQPYPRIDENKLYGRDGAKYSAHPDLLAAANAALAIERPLLLTGEAGCGKTDFAHAVSHALTGSSKTLGTCYVRSDTRARDLLYEYDALRRYGDAQTGQPQAGMPNPYITLKPLGRSLVHSTIDRPPIVLIDEIDKAPRDLPNDLLQELDRAFFEIPELAHSAPAAGIINMDDSDSFRFRMERPDDAPKPFVIITSNVERQLPDPFLRRCVFFFIPFPDDEMLRRILMNRFDSEDGFIAEAVTVFSTLRRVRNLTKKPGTSELIDWFKVLNTVYEPATTRRLITGFAQTADFDEPLALPWRDVPALSCIVKLREDLHRLNALGAGA